MCPTISRAMRELFFSALIHPTKPMCTKAAVRKKHSVIKFGL